MLFMNFISIQNMSLKTTISILSLFFVLFTLAGCDKIEEILLPQPSYSDIDYDAIADENLQLCVASLAGGNASELTELLCIAHTVSSTVGIEQFTNLRTLVLADNRLRDIDLSPFATLEYLDLSSNILSEVDTSNNPLLVHIDLSENKGVTPIGLSSNAVLEFLNMRSCEVDDLDISQNLLLEELVLEGNLFSGDVSRFGNSSLDLSANVKLLELNLNDNEISSIDFVSNEKLDVLLVKNNMLSGIIDFTKNTNLTELDLSGNALTEIDLRNNRILDTVALDNNELANINLPLDGKLRLVYLSQNKLSCDNASCNGNSFFTMPKNDELLRLDLANNLLENEDIDLSQNLEISELFLSENSGIAGTFNMISATHLVELNLTDTNVTDLSFGFSPPISTAFALATKIHETYNLQDFKLVNTSIDQFTKDVIDELENQKDQYFDDTSDISYIYE